MMENGLLVIKDKELSLYFSPIEMHPTFETIEIGGETEEEFQTRRNTFSRWLFGLPKKRNYPIGSVAVPVNMNNNKLHIVVNAEDLSYFKEWIKLNYGDYDIKRDGILSLDSGTGINFYGMFVSEYADNGKIILVYDYLEKIRR